MDKIDADNVVHVKEFGTDSCSDIYMSATDPVKGQYAKGQTFMIGDYKVAVKELGDKSATVEITAKNGEVTSKKLYIDPVNGKWLMQSMVERDKCYVVSKDGKALVHLDIRPGFDQCFADGKVKLVAYTDVIDVQNGTDWPTDTRFLARPET